MESLCSESKSYSNFDMQESAEKDPISMKLLKCIEKDSRRDDGDSHVVGTPLLEVLSVSIESNDLVFDDGKPCQLCGSFNVVDGEGFSFLLYDREDDDPEPIPIGGSITLENDILDSFISPFPYVKINIHLKDIAREGIDIAKGELILDNTDEVDFDKITTTRVEGEHGYVVVRYIIYRCAVVATFEPILLQLKGDVGGDVYGIIVAHCVNYISDSDVQQDRSIMLLDVSEDHPLKVEREQSITLYRNVVTVPAYSSHLVIEANLSICGRQLVCDCVGFDVQFHNIHCVEDVLGQNGQIKIGMYWSHPFMHQRLLKYSTEETPDVERENEDLDRVLHVDGEPIRISNLSLGCIPMEVFSVVAVSGDEEEVSSVNGTIVAEHKGTSCIIFEKEKKSAEVLLSGSKNLPLEGPPLIMTGDMMGVTLNLEDSRGREISKGWVAWQGFSIHTPIPWYDRRLCSVIRGKHGYAAVHYTVFSTAHTTTVKVVILSKRPSNCRARVSGELVASYGDHKYPTRYERDYYQRKLFEKLPEDAVELSSGSEMPLSRSVVPVPEKSTLVVRANLHVEEIEVTTKGCETFEGNVKLSIGDESSHRIVGKFYDIEVCVEWGWFHTWDYRARVRPKRRTNVL